MNYNKYIQCRCNFFQRMNFLTFKFVEAAFKPHCLCFVLKFICIMKGEICPKVAILGSNAYSLHDVPV